MELILLISGIGVLLVILFGRRKRKPLYNGPVTSEWKSILNKEVSFYSQLNVSDKQKFEVRVQHFLNTTRITGINTTVELTDKLLVGASAIIPVFAFPDWEYVNLYEVLLYPSSFNENFKTNAPDGNILGMVGSGYMEGKMILSKPALRKGFSNARDKKNVGIHEFVHLIDKADGSTDGIPEALIRNQFAIPWIEMIRKNIEEINTSNSDINPYGGTNNQEFFSVISEYFFERPKLLRQKHPELYEYLSKIFMSDLGKTYQFIKTNREIGRNDPCPCGSRLKFKKCCGKINKQ